MPQTPPAQAAEATHSEKGFASLHMLSFAKNRSTGDFRAICTCGWGRVGPARDEESIRSQAAVHDREWVELMNEARS